MDNIRQTAIDRFRAYLERRQFSAHTLVSYTLDLHVFFTVVAVPLAQVSFREVDQLVEHQALNVVQGKGRKDRRVYMSPDTVASLHACLAQHPGAWTKGYVFWNRKRQGQLRSVKAIQKKMERYAKTAGITASCHSLRHTFASNLLEHGAEVVAIRDFLGQSQISSSERYAKISNQKTKQEYMRTMQKILKQGQV